MRLRRGASTYELHMCYKTSSAGRARLLYGIGRAVTCSSRHGGQQRRHKFTQSSAISASLDDISKPSWLDSLVSTLDDANSQHNGIVPDLRREFQAVCVRGNLCRVIDVLLQMEANCQFPCKSDYLCLLRAFSKRKALVQTKQIQAHFAQHSSKLSTSLKDILVVALVKCGAHDVALHVFETLQSRTVYSWTAIITAAVDLKKAKNAIELYRRMQEEGVEANQFTFVSLFKACSSLRDLKLGKDLHAEFKRRGFLFDIFVGNTLVSMYGKCGHIAEAEDVFNKLLRRNVVSWNAMLSVYVDQGQAEKALQFFKRMKYEGVTTTEATYVITLQACSLLGEAEGGIVIDGTTMKTEALKIGKALHDDLRKQDFHCHPFVGSSLINMYGKCGGITEAENVFRGLSQHDVVTWTAILDAYVAHGQGEKVLELYEEMQREGTNPDEQTLVIALQACCLLAEKEPASLVNGQAVKREALQVGRFLHKEARKRHFESNVFVASSLVMMYSKCGDIVEAENVFGYLTDVDNVAWNSMLSSYVDQGQGKKAIELFKQMSEEGACSDDVTLVCILQAASETGEVDICGEIHFSIVSAGCQLSRLFTSLIHAYGSCARMVDAEAVFDAICTPDVVLWSTLMAGFCQGGNSAACLQSFETMRFASLKPDRVIFLSLLSTCSHDGLVSEGVAFFDLMSKDYNMLSEVKHVVSLFDLLGRAGDFKRLKLVLSKLPVQPDEPLWLCLLAACRNHGNVEMARFAFDHVVQLQPKKAGAYVLMSNMCVDVGMFDSASQVNKCGKEVGALEEGWLDAHSFMDLEHTIGELILLQ